jgi:DNA-binding NtrC family response regulator
MQCECEDMPLDTYVGMAEKQYLQKMLVKYGNNRMKISRLLKISRAKFYRKLKEYGIT